MTIPESQVPPYPKPPPLDRGVRLYWYQWLGMSVFATIVVLASAGLFGESRADAGGRSAALELRVEYPTRLRYKQIGHVRIWVTNTSAQPVDTLTVALDTAYLNRFSQVMISPAAERPWETVLTDVRPGATRLINAELQAERYGRHEGVISAAPTGAGMIRVRVHTIVFP